MKMISSTRRPTLLHWRRYKPFMGGVWLLVMAGASSNREQLVQAQDAPPVAPPAAAEVKWTRVYRNDFASLDDVVAFQSSPTLNSTLKPIDASNSRLQKPTLKSNVLIQDDAEASDGKAIVAWTRPGAYRTKDGEVSGWTNGRWMLATHHEDVPVRIKVRLKMTPSIGVKNAVMWWPAGGGWPWEVDFAETFGGQSLSDYWGSRQNIGQRWHSDINSDGQAKEQLTHDDAVDATQYRVFDLFITPDHMWVEIDGVKKFETTDKRWIPKGKGFFSVGKALTGKRSGPHSEDAVFVDWIEIYK